MSIGANALLCASLQGVMMFGVLIGIFSTLSYGLDAFKSQANEIFIMNMVFKVSRMRSSQCATSLALTYLGRTFYFTD
jgi:hypothetical protein